MRHLCLLFVLGFIHSIGHSADAVPEITSPTQYLMQRWTLADGLPESEVMGVTQTPDGFLWCVTRNHLVRFDWFLTIGGLVLIENNVARVFPFDPSIPPENNILAYSASWRPGNPSLWLGRLSGLYRFADGQYRAVANPFSEGNQGKVVYAGPKRLWVGCGENVVWRETAANWNALPPFAQPRGDEIRHLHESRDGTLWAGTCRAVLCWQGSRWVSMAREDSGFPLEIRGICEDLGGNLWMACGGGLR